MHPLHPPPAFYEAQRLYNAELACLCCGINTHPDKDNDLYWLECQAEHLPAHLMIPVFTAPAFIREELLTLRCRFPDADEEAPWLPIWNGSELQ